MPWRAGGSSLALPGGKKFSGNQLPPAKKHDRGDEVGDLPVRPGRHRRIWRVTPRADRTGPRKLASGRKIPPLEMSNNSGLDREREPWFWERRKVERTPCNRSVPHRKMRRLRTCVAFGVELALPFISFLLLGLQNMIVTAAVATAGLRNPLLNVNDRGSDRSKRGPDGRLMLGRGNHAVARSVSATGFAFFTLPLQGHVANKPIVECARE